MESRKKGAFGMAFCPKCGRPVSDTDSFCSNCGDNLKIADNSSTHNVNLNIGRQYNPYKTNSYAIWSIVLACSSFVFGWGVVAIVAIVLGNMAKDKIRQSHEQGYNLATAGIVLGWVNIGLTVLAVFSILIFVLCISSYI